MIRIVTLAEARTAAVPGGRMIEVEHSGDRPDLVDMAACHAGQLLAARGRGGVAVRGEG